MSWATFLLYFAAVAVLVLTPGPTMLMTMTQSVAHGPNKGMAAAAGSMTAGVALMVLSALGLGAVIAASDMAFTALKWVGGGYLVFLGFKTFFSKVSTFDAPGRSNPSTGTRAMYLQGLGVGASNPKALLFFGAFFPQFIDASQPVLGQFFVMAITFLACELTMLTVCSLFAARLSPWLRQQGRAKAFNRVSGGLFVGMGCALLVARK